jgi:transcriptional regulator with XRE-family HTH domain
VPSRMDRNIGERIRQCRERAGLSQGQLADKLGISGTELDSYETGSARAKAATLFAMRPVDRTRRDAGSGPAALA